MIVVIDFDGVLFDVERFKRDYYRIFKGLGVSKRVYEDAYQHGVREGGGVYSHLHHFAVLQKSHPTLSPERLERSVAALIRHGSDYVYRDAIPFLSSFEEHGARLILLSSGLSFQKEKVEASGLSRFFTERIIIANPTKSSSMTRVIKRFPKKNIFFLDDRNSVADDIKKECPDVYVIQVRRSERFLKSAHADYVVKNLSEARRIIEVHARWN